MTVENSLWKGLLGLKKKATNKNCIGWAYTGNSFVELLSKDEINNDFLALLIKTSSNFDEDLEDFDSVKTAFKATNLFANQSISKDDLIALQNYWALSVIHHLDLETPYVFTHAAISMDGYLATINGHSHWIGNDENLVHAHRLRALLDSVLIGCNTVKNDSPSLNVRHVEGDNPIRLILSNTSDDFSCLKQIEDTKTFLLRSAKNHFEDEEKTFDKIIYYEGETQKEKIQSFLNKCKQENIKSILVEGGGKTLSSFIETGFVNNIQFHIAPLLFGNGIKAVNLSDVNFVNEALKLEEMQLTQVGDSFMVTTALL